MARKKKATLLPADGNDSLLQAAQGDYGREGVYTADEHGKYFIGIPLQSLSLEYLLTSNVLVLGMTYGVSGPPQSFKSALSLEFGRLIASMGGTSAMAETEGRKISPKLVEDLYQELARRLIMRHVSNIEDAQEFLTRMIGYGKEKFPNRDYLLSLHLDSLNGAASRERGEKIDKEGFASRDFPSEALVWGQWMKATSNKLTGWPMIFMFVNHEKRDIDSQNKYAKRQPGGVAQKFHSTCYLSVSRVSDNIKGVDKTVTHLGIKVIKTSFGELGRRISTAVVNDKTTKRIYFDWGHSTAQLLMEHKARIKDIITVTSSSDSMTALTRTFSCQRLGLKGVTGAELGVAVHSDEGLMNELREALEIRKFAVWDGSMPDAESIQIDHGDVSSLQTINESAPDEIL
jgi:hypothetical protein